MAFRGRRRFGGNLSAAKIIPGANCEFNDRLTISSNTSQPTLIDEVSLLFFLFTPKIRRVQDYSGSRNKKMLCFPSETERLMEVYVNPAIWDGPSHGEAQIFIWFMFCLLIFQKKIIFVPVSWYFLMLNDCRM